MGHVRENNQIGMRWGTMRANSQSTVCATRKGSPSPLILDRYISWEIVRPFISGLGLLVLVFVGFSAAKQLSLAADGQLEMLVALKLVGLSTLITLEILLPSALFFSVLAAIGRIHSEAEMNVLYASGVSPMRILESVFKLAVVVALITGYISLEGRPWAFRESYRLEAEALAKFDLKKMASGRFVAMEGSDYTFIADGLDLERGLHEGVFLQRDFAGDRKRTEVIVAKSASLPMLNPGQALTANFYNGYYYLLDNQKRKDVTLEFKQMTIHLPFQEAHEKYRRKAETTVNLLAPKELKDIAEYQWRMSTPLVTLLLAMMAVPLARTRPRESRSRAIFIALVVYISIFSLISIARTSLEQGRLNPTPGLWGAYLIMTSGLWLLVKPPKWMRQ